MELNSTYSHSQVSWQRNCRSFAKSVWGCKKVCHSYDDDDSYDNDDYASDDYNHMSSSVPLAN